MAIFKTQRIPQYPKPKPFGGKIKCHYCKAPGHIEIYTTHHRITPGWKVVWVRLRPVCVCPECAAERVARVKAALNLNI